MFRDLVKVKFRAGKGGDGKVAFGPHNLPMGGIGGDGGSVYLEGDNNLYDLSLIKPEYLYTAQNGEMGGVKNQSGRGGTDFVLKVPLVTKVIGHDGREMALISKHGEKILVAKGGRGGLGNWFFRAGRARTAEKSTPGQKGEELIATLQLELQSDIIFIGLPNAGKSSVLNELTNATSKVAAYPFTTLNPHLGQMGKIKLMDLPGLIENTAKGKGLGISFVKHTKSAKLIAHFVSLESADPYADYQLIRRELREIDAELATRPEVIVLTKSDLVSSPQEKSDNFRSLNKPLCIISIYDSDSLVSLTAFLSQNLPN